MAFVLFWGGWLYAVSTNQRQRMISAALVLLLLGLANLLLANRGSRNRFLRLTAPLSVLPMLVLIIAFNPIARSWLTPDPSGKSLALILEEIQSLRLPESEFYVSSMKRGQQFGISFYLHREIQTWDPENPKTGFLLLPMRDCDPNEVKAPWYCSWRSIELGSTGWVAYRVHQPRTPGPTSR